MSQAVYGLIAAGKSALSGKRDQFPSVNLFYSEAEALAEMEQFKKRVCEADDRTLDCLELDGINIQVVKYNLNG